MNRWWNRRDEDILILEPLFHRGSQNCSISSLFLDWKDFDFLDHCFKIHSMPENLAVLFPIGFEATKDQIRGLQRSRIQLNLTFNLFRNTFIFINKIIKPEIEKTYQSKSSKLNISIIKNICNTIILYYKFPYN